MAPESSFPLLIFLLHLLCKVSDLSKCLLSQPPRGCQQLRELLVSSFMSWKGRKGIFVSAFPDEDLKTDRVRPAEVAHPLLHPSLGPAAGGHRLA